MRRRSILSAVAASAVLLTLSWVPASAAVPSRDYVAGRDNPMCVTIGDAGGRGTNCLKVSDQSVRRGQQVTFTATFRYGFAAGQRLCLARSDEPYGDYAKIAACSRVTRAGTLTIRAYLGLTGTYYYDLGLPRCLRLEPSARPPSSCGDNGGMASMPVKVTVR